MVKMCDHCPPHKGKLHTSKRIRYGQYGQYGQATLNAKQSLNIPCFTVHTWTEVWTASFKILRCFAACATFYIGMDRT